MCHITGDSQYGGVALPPEAASQGSELSLEGGGGALIHYVWILDECFLLIASTSRVMGSQTDAATTIGLFLALSCRDALLIMVKTESNQCV